ncbi:hypothetical protein M0R88_16225 [Halorussus gelatinilyticus]|uniref:Uncharacterized protein n=1 Tax=Halorussus gelatinilyticus TaxID=2937524 RepID=A0A8U0IG28_9EURY|nr:hypothetical protein [Halorussus gelatinilyticus]UPW00047.1 hypothetical protein M0R88_16225 [Halorussus gelatinilyticus]
MARHTRRSAIRGIAVAGATLTAGCLGSLSDLSERSVTYALDDVFVENAASVPVEFEVKVIDGETVKSGDTIRLAALRDGQADYEFIEKPWMSEPSRYGVEVVPAEGEPMSVTLSDVLDRWDDSIHDYRFIEYAILYRSDETFGISPDFYDEPRSA